MENLKKVLIFSSFGLNSCTPEMEKILNKKRCPQNRVGEIIDYLEHKAVFMENDFDKIQDYLKKDKNNLVKIEDKGRDIYIIWDDNVHWTSSFTIKEVDISRPWTIEDYDGAERIHYLDDFELIDSQLNYYRLK